MSLLPSDDVSPRNPRTAAFVVICGLLGSHPLHPPSEEPAKKDPIAPRFRSELGKATTGSPFREGYRWSYTSGGKFSLFLETRRGTEGGGLRLTRLEAKRNTFFWTDKLLLGLKDGKLADYGDGFDRFADQAPPPLLVFPLESGRRWRFDEPRDDSGIRLPSGFEAVVVGKDEITVPAGAFEAWRIEYVLLPRFGIEHDFRAWYTPGLGFLRIEKWRESDPDGKKVLEKPIVHELVSIEEIATAHRIDYPSAGEPVAKLPKHVQAAPGQVTLFADFGDVWDGQVVLYLINRTEEPIYSPLPGWEWWVKLEAKDASGSWERAQPHFHEFCTVGERSAILDPGRFIELLGYLPERGEPRDVRYRLHGDVKVLSGSGPGLAEPQDIREARHDKIAIHAADAALLKRFFLEDAGLSDRLRDMERDAFRRLAVLPNEQAMPLVESLLSNDQWMRDSHELILENLKWHDHERFLAYVKGVLDHGPAERRMWLLEDLEDVPFDWEIKARLMEEARNPEAPGLPKIFAWLASLEHEEIKPLLAEIERSPAYSQRDRILAGLRLASVFGTPVVTIHVDTHDDPASPPGKPGVLDVAITNASSAPLRFRYSDPINLLKLYAWVDGELLIPRPTVEWFTKPDAKARETKVLLGDGESHFFHLNLLDYFDVPPSSSGENQEVSIAVSCSIPGRHEVPQVAGGHRHVRIPRQATAQPGREER